MGRESRRRNRTRSAARAASGAGTASTSAPGAVSSAAPVQVRTDRVIERESTLMVTESKRVLWVSAVCFGMLAVLVVVDRLQ